MSTEPQAPIWLINLDSNPERFQSATAQLAAFGLTAERFSAVYGKTRRQLKLQPVMTPH